MHICELFIAQNTEKIRLNILHADEILLVQICSKNTSLFTNKRRKSIKRHFRSMTHEACQETPFYPIKFFELAVTKRCAKIPKQSHDLVVLVSY